MELSNKAAYLQGLVDGLYVRISTTRVAKAIIRDNASKTVITSPPLARE